MSGFIYDMLKLQNEWELTSCFQSLSFYCTTLSSLQLLCLLDDQSTAVPVQACHAQMILQHSSLRGGEGQ